MKEIKNKILSLIDENKSQINIALKEDGREFDFDITKVKKIISKASNYKNKEQVENQIVFTNGNPYTTLYILTKSLIEGRKLVISTNDNLIHLNRELVRIFNQLNTKKLFAFKNNISIRELYLTTEKKSNLIVEVFDDMNKYIELLECGFNATYISLFTIDLYYDSDEYEEMIEVIENYATSRYMELNVFKDKSYAEIVLRTGSELSSMSVLILTKNPKKYEVLVDKFKNKNMYINYNPFDDYEENVIKNIIKK